MALAKLVSTACMLACSDALAYFATAVSYSCKMFMKLTPVAHADRCGEPETPRNKLNT
jgi:hypothetical protein